MTSPKAPTKAPIDPTTAMMTVIMATSRQRRDCGGSGDGNDNVDSGRQQQQSPAQAEGRGNGGPTWLLSI